MVAVALIVLLFILLLTIAVLAGGGESVTIDLFGADLSTSGAGTFVIGLISGAVIVVCLWLLRIGLRKGWRQRRRIKDLERRADQNHDQEAPRDTPQDEATPNEHTPLAGTDRRADDTTPGGRGTGEGRT